MCGRFGLAASPAALAELLELDADACALAPRFNIAPSQPVVALRMGDGARELARLGWGLVPGWASDPKVGHKLINARCETAHQRPAFREAYARRRCLVPADGFFEWRRSALSGEPFWISLADGQPFAMAGLWERWRDPSGARLETCTILTTAANQAVAPIHDRMPVIVRRELQAAWLDPLLGPAELAGVFAPMAASALRAWPVERYVNDPRDDRAICRAPKASLLF